jgi:hypothetical protein
MVLCRVWGGCQLVEKEEVYGWLLVAILLESSGKERERKEISRRVSEEKCRILSWKRAPAGRNGLLKQRLLLFENDGSVNF